MLLYILAAAMLASLLMGGMAARQNFYQQLKRVHPLLAGLAWWFGWFTIFLLLTQRPIFAAATTTLLHGVLLAVNHSKIKMLREPFVLQDFEYFTDAIRHPRLYIPFFGITKTLLLLLLGMTAIILFLWLEPALAWHDPSLFWPLSASAFVIGILAAVVAWYMQPGLTYDTLKDYSELGMVGLLHAHLKAFWQARKQILPQPAQTWPRFARQQKRPHMLLVQSESFFDPRTYYNFVDSSVLENWDRIKGEAIEYGMLKVPAWGANTVRTEAAVLTGLSQDKLGIYCYNPYRKLAKHPVCSLASHLRDQGYQTVCVHPYPGHFYLRDRVMPALGFDQFIDSDSFSSSDREGPYVGDKAVAKRVAKLLEASEQPLFIFVITMENHGPLHMEEPPQSDGYLSLKMPEGYVNDLLVYLRHLKNADAMLGSLTRAVQSSDRGGSICWYGDHVPIMPEVYRHSGYPSQNTPWLLWCSDQRDVLSATTTDEAWSAEELAAHWLRQVVR